MEIVRAGFPGRSTGAGCTRGIEALPVHIFDHFHNRTPCSHPQLQADATRRHWRQPHPLSACHRPCRCVCRELVGGRHHACNRFVHQKARHGHARNSWLSGSLLCIPSFDLTLRLTRCQGHIIPLPGSLPSYVRPASLSHVHCLSGTSLLWHSVLVCRWVKPVLLLLLLACGEPWGRNLMGCRIAWGAHCVSILLQADHAAMEACPGTFSRWARCRPDDSHPTGNSCRFGVDELCAQLVAI